MTKSRLEIDGVDVGFDSELPISQNLSIADVREPGKANSTFSKTISIPGTPEIKKLFEFIFQVNSTLDSFNPNLKTPAKYYVNEVLVFDGSLQLLRINNKYANDYLSTTFECNLIGVNANLFLDIAGLYLTDLDLSDLDHVFSYSSGLFNPTLGQGYCYGYQDYGINPTGQRLTDTWYFKYLKPLVFEKEYVNRILEDAGYTLEDGGYFDSSYAERILIPDTKAGGLLLAPSDIADNECYIGRSGTYTGSVKNGTIVSGNSYKFYNPTEDIETNIPYNDETSPYSDPNNRWDGVTNFEFTSNQQGVYYLHGTIKLTYNIVSYPTNAVTYSSNGKLGFAAEILISSDNGSSWGTFGSVLGQVEANSVSVNDPVELTFSVTNPNILLGANYLVRIQLRNQSLNYITFYDVGNNEVSSPSASIRIDIEEGSIFRAKMAFPDLEEGQTVRMNTTIPENITQLDFLTSIIRLENLYFEPSKSVKNQYIADSRDDFFETDASGALDWTDKWDISKVQEIIPMGELDWNRLRFTYKADQDHYNKKYFDKYKEVYGTEIRDIENDFIKKEKVVEVVFSATPTAGTPVNDIVAPRYYTYDESTGDAKPIKCNIRRLYWGGLIDCQTHNFIYSGTDHFVTQYPFVGHVDHPLSSTVDLCWDNPLELYWFFPGATYTDNNRYNERYSKQITETTDQNSKIVRMWFNLNENDINSFSFKKLIFVRDTYYYANKIMDYNPQKKSVTQVELLKLKPGSVFVPSTLNIDDLGGDDDVGIFARTQNTQNGTGIIIGTGNFNNQAGAFIVGDNNVVG